MTAGKLDPHGAWLQRGVVDRRRGAGTNLSVAVDGGPALATAADELCDGLADALGVQPVLVAATAPEARRAGTAPDAAIVVAAPDRPLGRRALSLAGADAGAVETLVAVRDPDDGRLLVTASTEAAVVRAVHAVVRRTRLGTPLEDVGVTEATRNRIRMLDHWDNLDGTVERGYAGRSIFFAGGRLTRDWNRVGDYCRLLASVGVNAVCVNNVNVSDDAAALLFEPHLQDLAELAAVLGRWGIRLWLSVSFAAPITCSGLPSADPCDPEVQAWWASRALAVYSSIPDLGGFVVKADSEHRPGPHRYGRSHAEGANLIARAVGPYGGTVFWRAFVYDCEQDWRDRSTDRARAAYDLFKPLDGAFSQNVVLQVKSGPMDFQVREPHSPLLGALRATALAVELQVTQEYTGQQRDLCYLAPQWHETLTTEVEREGIHSLAELATGGIVGVANVGDDRNWTGHLLAQANLYAFGRLAWDPTLPPATIAREWAMQTFGADETVVSVVESMLMASWGIYERYTAPLGVGWMVTPHTHYGPSVDGYEYSRWGTYHFADRDGVGVDRTTATGSGFAGQYDRLQRATYEQVDECPDELLLFFHHVGYRHRLHSGQTVIQHIYDTHFDGAVGVEWLLARWSSLEDRIDLAAHAGVRARLEGQLSNARQWRDVVNTYFFRKSGIPDEQGRAIAP